MDKTDKKAEAPCMPSARRAVPTPPIPTKKKAAATPKRAPRKPPEAPQAERMDEKRTNILRAALALFSRVGMHGTSIDQVAQAAALSKSNLLYHFANKEALYVAVLRELLQVWLEPLRQFSAEQDPREAIADYIARKLALSRDRPDASRLFCLEMIQGAPLLRDELGRELRDLVEQKSAVIRSWIASGRLAPVEPHHLIFTLWATTQHYADFAVQVETLTGRTLADPAFFEEAVRNVQTIVLGGILPAA
jgi:TetR/AcrR family transcriptional regulator